MHAIKKCTLELANLGKPMDPEDITAKVLRGLDSTQYRSIIETVEARDTPISFAALHEKLIHHELTHKTATTTPLPASAYATQYRPAPQRPYPRHNSAPILPTPSSFPSPENPPTICQYCGFKGHTFSQCRNFKRTHPDLTVKPFTRTPRSLQSRAQVHAITTTSAPSSSWIVDSGASHHITNDLSTLSLHAPYDGNDGIMIGDGSSLPISNIGSFTISHYPSTLNFKNVLHVPSISRNILSVSQFCRDNNAIIEFSPSTFFSRISRRVKHSFTEPLIMVSICGFRTLPKSTRLNPPPRCYGTIA